MTAQHSSVLEENQRLRAKLENLEQVLKVPLYSDTTYIIVFNSGILHLQKNCLSSVCVCVLAYARGRRAKAAAGIGT